MNFLADESIDMGIIHALRNRGFEVFSILESYKGISDQTVLEMFNKHHCLLLTEDKDFDELVYRLQLNHSGILLIRVTGIERIQRIQYISDIISKHYKDMEKRFSVLMHDSLRIR